jgi:hypothetical protein
MVKFFFADQGDIEDARRALEELLSHAGMLLEAFRVNTASYTDGQGPFPERLHIGAVRGRFIHNLAEALARWATWARHEVDRWPDTGSEAAPLGKAIQHENERLAALVEGDEGQMA